ncbi:hypothetical protein GGR55DRAFT_497544 [Xylaria sp. FL0064]|nr:hypothetical protein GGR55DRAFT_497544 [Xylaria sp. FL0064]
MPLWRSIYIELAREDVVGRQRDVIDAAKNMMYLILRRRMPLAFEHAMYQAQATLDNSFVDDKFLEQNPTLDLALSGLTVCCSAGQKSHRPLLLQTVRSIITRKDGSLDDPAGTPEVDCSNP